QYLPYIRKYAGGVASENFLKAIMYNESKCGTQISSSAGAYGLMQFLVPTAKAFAPRCGVSGSVVDSNWLKNPANYEKQVCMSAEYFRDIAKGPCGTLGGDAQRHTIAGYNGGPSCGSDPNKGACCASSSCTGASCDGSQTRRWECTANTGFTETRKYVQ